MSENIPLDGGRPHLYLVPPLPEEPLRTTYVNPIPVESPLGPSPLRLRLGLAAFRQIVGDLSVSGAENVQELPDGRPLVIASSHLTDVDMGLAGYALRDDVNMDLVGMSITHRLKTGNTDKLSIMAVGEASFPAVDYAVREDGREAPTGFNPNNFYNLLRRMSAGKAMMIAAQNPSKKQEYKKPGLGAVYTAAISGALILPVSVVLETPRKDLGMKETAIQTLRNRPPATVTFGELIEFDRIDHIHSIKVIMDRRKIKSQYAKVTPEDIQEFSKAKRELQEQAATVLDTIKELDETRSHR